jgi:opacity protein-like surface antigen
MNSRTRYGLLLAMGVAAIPAAQAADSPWSVSVFGGGAVAEDGSLRSPETSNLSDLGSIDAALSGTTGVLRLDRLKFDDLYHNRFSAGAEVSYDYQSNMEAFTRFSYDSGDGRQRAIGSLAVGAATAQPIDARFSDEDAWTAELGSRFYFPASETLKPFAAISIGATHLEGIKAALALPNGPLEDVRFTRNGTVFSQSLEAGLEYAAMENLDLRFSLDATHFGAAPSVRNPTALETGFRADTSRDRWAFPVSIGAVYHFG